MKKLIILVVAMFAISFAGNNLFAKNDDTPLSVSVNEQEVAPVPDLIINKESVTPETSPAEENPSEAKSDAGALTMNDLQTIVSLLNNTVGDKKQNILGGGDKVFVPLSKHGKIGGHHICQRLELSILTGTDKSAEDKVLEELGVGDGKTISSNDAAGFDNFLDNIAGKSGGFNYGANFGYSVVFVPGYKEGDELLLNSFGFGYSVGAICQFDREKDKDITCDFLGKFGIETGFNKAIGIGIDVLFGGGKTSQVVLDFSNIDEKDPKPEDVELMTESLWCGKAGAQLWLRLNFLTKSIRNFDTALFTRYVYSFRPYSEDEFIDTAMLYKEVQIWQYESWQFGFTMTYFF